MIIDNKVVYRKVINPSYIRKDTLLIAIESIKLLQDYEKIKSLRKEKYKLLDLGKERVSELNKNLLKLKDSIPKAKIKKPKPLKKFKKREIHHIEHHIEHRPVVSSLDSELESIKDKLENLKI
ncbi:MAG: hypothetical protein KJ674_02155 [Nanoarchaeota archaeon]|nr:hypothetical protein [Nanoarchaeota archaeon]